MQDWLTNPLLVRVFVTLLLIIAVAAARSVIAGRIGHRQNVPEERLRRDLFYMRSGLSLVLVIGLFMIWIGQIQSVLLSLTAVTVAIVIATKELLMCVSGFLLRTTGKLFSVGDWIECNGMRGEVTDLTLLSTTLLERETGARGYGFSGRTLILPNSVFLSHPVHRESPGRDFVSHRFGITLENPVDAAAAVDWLSRRAEEACHPFLEEARARKAKVQRQLGVTLGGAEPAVTMATTDLGKIHLHVALFCPTTKAVELEQQITADFLAAVRDGRVPGDHPDRASQESDRN
ncbi:MAG: mechanosensitive ion channel domain-containing protein [Halofilum sp. (in: g-proteobacteria)]